MQECDAHGVGLHAADCVVGEVEHVVAAGECIHVDRLHSVSLEGEVDAVTVDAFPLQQTKLAVKNAERVRVEPEAALRDGLQ